MLSNYAGAKNVKTIRNITIITRYAGATCRFGSTEVYVGHFMGSLNVFFLLHLKFKHIECCTDKTSLTIVTIIRNVIPITCVLEVFVNRSPWSWFVDVFYKFQIFLEIYYICIYLNIIFLLNYIKIISTYWTQINTFQNVYYDLPN